MKILLTAPYNDVARARLEEAFSEVVYKPWKPQGRAYHEEELMELLRQSNADALITEHDTIGEKLIASFPDLRFIGVCRGTPSNVAVQAATEAGIPVFYTPARNAQAVTEMFISNVICFYRKTIESVEWLKTGGWNEGAHTSYLYFKGNELAGKTVGMVGFGAIGQRIANVLNCLSCPVQFYDPFVESPRKEWKKESLEAIFATSDIVSIHLPVTPQTIGMIDRRSLSKMKRDALFVNTARASVVDRNHLLEVLESGAIRGAILDVFDSEPPDEIDNRIIHLPNVLATPHTAGATHEVEDHHASMMNEAVLEWLEKGASATHLLVNKEVLVSKTG
ncbi:MAG TPA: 2-hydroxyacid dehydrogenase [Flavisolibacter sp.]|jgi:D-3-phosphoglycerate dehydrogenase|nr:2-hydroxyacid dehydrogenase [Flavisolibacter sp.]